MKIRQNCLKFCVFNFKPHFPVFTKEKFNQPESARLHEQKKSSSCVITQSDLQSASKLCTFLIAKSIQRALRGLLNRFFNTKNKFL